MENYREEIERLEREKEILETDMRSYCKALDKVEDDLRKSKSQLQEAEAHINVLQKELKEGKDRQELPAEPIKVAEMLIYKTETRKNIIGQECEMDVYDKSDLKQIAEHLLVYCNNKEGD